jgi:hypothetical protein
MPYIRLITASMLTGVINMMLSPKLVEESIYGRIEVVGFFFSLQIM